MKEIWKDIDGYVGYYKVSSLGNVFSVKADKTLKQYIPSKGYITVKLYKDGAVEYHKVHRLVAKAFILNPDDKPQVNHIDHDKYNNKVFNLEWCTAKENTEASIKAGKNGQKGELNSCSTITDEQAHEICRRLQDKQRSCDIADDMQISRGIVNKIRTKQSWQHVSKIYTIPSRKRGLSKATVVWVVKELQNKSTPKEIVAKSKNKLTVGIVKHIKQRSTYTDWTKDFVW